MLIINADDWGGSKNATNKILECYKHRRLTSASAMVFMNDSERAAELARHHNIDIGLHLNFTSEFNGCNAKSELIERQHRVASFLKSSKYNFLIYNVRLKKDFHYLYDAQFQEYIRLYNKAPTHIDGHHHMHLCMNVLCDRLLPKGTIVRRNFKFFTGEKNFFNRGYRHILDAVLTKRHLCTDLFFSLSLLMKTNQFMRVTNAAKIRNVEVMTHPAEYEEYFFLMSDKFLDIISSLHTGNFNDLWINKQAEN